MTWRLPAEWEPQDAILLAWPHAGTDWAANLADVEASYVALIEAIARQQRVLLVVADGDVEARASHLLEAGEFPRDRLRMVRADYDDTWLRDSGPITVTNGAQFGLLDFRFTGWGGKFGGSRDDRLIEALHAQGLFGVTPRDRREYALEGGAIESDGAGTLLTTRVCLAQRHPELSRLALAQGLADQVPCSRVMMLDHGELEGDDTDGHIDTLVRFIAPEHLVYQSCEDPEDPHFAPLAAMAAELGELRTSAGKPYRLTALPWPSPIRAADGRRLAASYANFLIINGAVLMPEYGDAADDAARAVLANALPGRLVRPVPCRPLIEQNGSLHCLTMQLPRGVLSGE
ncbi:MAG: agmatine deiminase family protein [Lysobacterales bacterium]